MIDWPAALVAASAAIIALMGAVHLVLTGQRRPFEPRDDALLARMKTVPLRISRATTTWRAGLGFHASHSLGAMLFGAVYLELALRDADVLFGSAVLLAIGCAYLLGMCALAWRCWFRVPLAGVGLATALYLAALALRSI